MAAKTHMLNHQENLSGSLTMLNNSLIVTIINCSWSPDGSFDQVELVWVYNVCVL